MVDDGGIIAYPFQVATRLADERRALEEHIKQDHQTLKRLFDVHFPVEPRGFETFCNEDGFVWPCYTRRILTGEA